MATIGFGITLLSLIIWLGLLLFRGQFWRTDPQLERSPDSTHSSFGEAHEPPLSTTHYPSICAVIPARNEADLLPITLRSLLTQDYPGVLQIILVDDHSTDGTASVAQTTAKMLDRSPQLHIHQASPLPAGWTGKLWAMQQGIQQAEAFAPDYILLTDADIEHAPNNLSRLVAQAETKKLDMASVMVRLRCQSFWEKLLIPAFVFFFQKLYPFRWVNQPDRSIAAAAGGCILIRRDTLIEIGGIEVIRQALIDDCALAEAVKHRNSDRGPCGRIWLGLSDRTCSLRPYPSLQSIWDMVARTAFTQLNYSPLLLIGTLIGMVLVYEVPLIAFLIGSITADWTLALTGLAGWVLMSFAYLPMVRFYRCSPFLALCLPLIGLLYTLMTFDSALRHWRGQGGAWKGRVYANQ